MDISTEWINVELPQRLLAIRSSATGPVTFARERAIALVLEIAERRASKRMGESA